MAAPRTEALHDKAIGIDDRPLAEIAAILAEGQVAAAASVARSAEPIAAGARAMAETIRNDGRLHYVAAGSSGLMAAADALELGGTFSIPSSQLRIHMAGGMPTGVDMPGDTEDDTSNLSAEALGISRGDTVVAVSASGTTPYTVAVAKIAGSVGAAVVGIANNPDATLLTCAEFPIYLATPPELLSGSTRMGAGTAQKIALNMLSTLMAIELGHVHDGMMVNLRADNKKLRARAAGMVCQIAGVDTEKAVAALDQANGDVKVAVLVAAQSTSPDQARIILKESEGRLRAALARKGRY